MVNQVIVLGRVGTADFKTTSSGKSVANISVATNKTYTDSQGEKKTKTQWHRCVVWGRTAEFCDQHVSKGNLVYVEGELETRSYEKDGQKQYATEIRVNRLQKLGGSPSENSNQEEMPF